MLIKMTAPNVNVSNTEHRHLDEKFEGLFKETLEHWHVPGVSVAVVDGEKTYAQVRSF
jgi:hypothetical protein